jgi:hypothetical protein
MAVIVTVTVVVTIKATITGTVRVTLKDCYYHVGIYNISLFLYFNRNKLLGKNQVYN